MDKQKTAETDDQDNGIVDTEDEGHIELVLRVLASMCDGQNTVLQVRELDQVFLPKICEVNLVAFHSQ